MDCRTFLLASILSWAAGPALAGKEDGTPASATPQPTPADPTSGEQDAEEPADRKKFERMVGTVFGDPSFVTQVEAKTAGLRMHDRVAAVWIIQQANKLRNPTGGNPAPEAVNQFRETIDRGIQKAYDQINAPPPEGLRSVIDGLQHLYVNAQTQRGQAGTGSGGPPKTEQAAGGLGAGLSGKAPPTPQPQVDESRNARPPHEVDGPPPGEVAPWLGLDAVTGGNPAVVRSLGRAQWASKDYQGTYDSYSRLFAGGDRSGEVRRWRGLAAERAGDYELAHREAQAALDADPKDRVALSLLRLTENRVSRARLPEAGRMSAAALESEAALAESGALGSGGRAAAGGLDPAATIREVQRGSGGDSRGAAAGLVREARTFLTLKDAGGAVLLATKAVELDAKNAAAYHVRAVAQSQLGRFEEAARDASSSLSLVEPSQGFPALKTRAWALSSLRRFPEALQDSLRAKSIKPSDGFVLMSEARALGGLGRRSEMVERLREAARIEPERYRPLYDAALQLPSDADTEALFAGVAGGPATPAPAPASDGGWRRLRLIAYCLAGGLLIALGLSHFGVTDKATTTARRLLAGEEERQAPAAAAEPAASSASGFWSRYDDVRELARGGMGIVYEATDRGLGRRVAVKKMREELRTDPRERERFLKEARTVAALQHPNIVQIYQVAEDGFDAFLVFEHVDGETLHDRLRRSKRLELAESVEILRGVAAAVEHAHDHGLTHRDLKPSNIMIDREGVVKVMDFGIARQAKDAVSKLSMTNTVCGTPPYMAPEQEQGLVCKESDVFSLGVVAYELLSGTLPFEGAPGAMLLAKMSARFDPLSSRVEGLPAGVDQALARALCPDPAARFRRPSDLVQALGALVDAKA